MYLIQKQAAPVKLCIAGGIWRVKRLFFLTSLMFTLLPNSVFRALVRQQQVQCLQMTVMTADGEKRLYQQGSHSVIYENLIFEFPEDSGIRQMRVKGGRWENVSGNRVYFNAAAYMKCGETIELEFRVLQEAHNRLLLRSYELCYQIHESFCSKKRTEVIN